MASSNRMVAIRGRSWVFAFAFGFIGTPDSEGSSLPFWCRGYAIGSRKTTTRLDFGGNSGSTTYLFFHFLQRS
jgi:hypothetical protein